MGVDFNQREWEKMNTTFTKLMRASAVGLLAATIGLAGCTSDSDRSFGQKFSDRQVASAVKKQLSSDPLFKYSDVEPIVHNGTVQLSGFVEKPEQRLRAAELASQAKGARQIINQLMIKPMPTGPAKIHDPLGQDSGRLLVDTNTPVPQMRNLPESSTQPAPPTQP